MTKFKHLPVTLVFLVFVIVSLACNLPGGQAVFPSTAIPMSEEEAGQLEESLKATLANPVGEVTLTITQQQINAYLISQLSSQNEQIISDPVITLADHQIELYGKITQGGLSVNTKIVFEPRIDASGDPKFAVVSMDLGGLTAPDTMKNQAETMINDALMRYLTAGSARFKITSIAVGEGQITVTGAPQP